MMAKTLLDVDQDLLAEATAALGTATDTDTVNTALRLVVGQSRARRERALAELQAIADEGGFDFEGLSKLDQ
ncbi:type II toxin-antitoxin system VapB family antitoxin [Catellatospora coxensis]|nr:type II toxin-antitoxin system VapB family antitoxin [Catellatospora coxensis]